MLTIEKVRSEDQLGIVRTLLREYAALRDHDPALGNFERELAELSTRYGEPGGELLLARWEGGPAGCVAIRALEEDICEMKRLYVSPSFRSRGIGKELVECIIEAARRKGYALMRLDSHPWMQRAQHLYECFGFREIDAYNDNPTPGIRFFELSLLSKRRRFSKKRQF